MNPLERTVLRYLGYNLKNIDETKTPLTALIKEVNEAKDLLSKTEPKYVTGIWDCVVNEDTISFGGQKIKSSALAEHMKDAVIIGLIAVTLGTQADMLIQRYSVTNIKKSAIINSVASVTANDACKKAEAELRAHPDLIGFPAYKRFSPGFGDFDLSNQEVIIQMLDANKRIGLSLTADNMLVPTKSVTAVVGFYWETM